MKDWIVNPISQNEYNELMQLLEKQGWTWVTREKPSNGNIWKNNGTCIRLSKSDKTIAFADMMFYKSQGYYFIMSLMEYKNQLGLNKTVNLNKNVIRAIMDTLK